MQVVPGDAEFHLKRASTFRSCGCYTTVCTHVLFSNVQQPKMFVETVLVERREHMAVAEQLENAHLLVISTVDNLPELEWDMPMSEGGWTVKDSIAHLASYELILKDVLRTFADDASETPYLARYLHSNDDLRREEVSARSSHTAQQVIDEYQEVQTDTTGLLARISAETLEKKGTLSWYGEDRSLSDLIRSISAHIQRHCDEITEFRNREQQ